MVHAKTLNFVQRDKHSRQKQLVFFFKRQCETIDDAAQNLEELCNAVEALRLVYKLEEDVVNGTADIRSQIEEFAVDAVQGGLQEVPFARIFRVKQFEQLQPKSVVTTLNRRFFAYL